MTDAPIRVSLTWSEPLLRELLAVAQARTSGKRKHPLRRFALALGVGALVGGFVGAGLAFADIRFQPGVLWIVPGLAFVTILWWVTYRRTIARWLTSELSAPIRTGETVTVLSAEGIETTHTAMTTQIDWSAVTDLRDAPLALHVMLSGNLSIPIPDTVLPDGLTRAELRGRIEAWRAGH